jgi:hypothetical protein
MFLSLLCLMSSLLLGLLCYLAVQFASYSAIIYLKIQSVVIAEKLSSSLPSSITILIVPAAITFINSASPNIFKLITNFEKWDSGQTNLNVLLFRMFFSNILNVIIQVAIKLYILKLGYQLFIGCVIFIAS